MTLGYLARVKVNDATTNLALRLASLQMKKWEENKHTGANVFLLCSVKEDRAMSIGCSVYELWFRRMRKASDNHDIRHK